jgi:aspartyl-tRNA(Asn)/glutamyl-tRNA(Gln) amidotransferase subunit C
MAALTREDVEEIALLARLALTDAEIEAMRVDLSAILGHMDALAEVDTSGVQPMTHAVPMDLRLRPDEPRPSLPGEAALAGAPQVRDGSFVVPNIIKTAADRE